MSAPASFEYAVSSRPRWFFAAVSSFSRFAIQSAFAALSTPSSQ
ncbi:hypothetical protein [Streptomyces sp. NBC_00162]|nr:hypothetical protein [Streptomyces sp. NBC_00162]UUU44125.1 hypothetical protein JIW86_38310 [Streptomyces sp. NBC_00162]